MILKLVINIVKAVGLMIAFLIIILALDIVLSGTIIDREPIVGLLLRQLGM